MKQRNLGKTKVIGFYVRISKDNVDVKVAYTELIIVFYFNSRFSTTFVIYDGTTVQFMKHLEHRKCDQVAEPGSDGRSCPHCPHT